MKTVLITGAGGNLGAACVNVFASNGWKVIALVTPGKLPDRSMPGVLCEEADLLKEDETGSLIDRLSASQGPIDAALLLVGGFESGAFGSTDSVALQRMFALNFQTAYHVARPLFRHMQARGQGRLVFIGARPAMDAQAGKSLLAYGLSKSLLFKLAEYLNAAAAQPMAQVVVFQALDTPQNRAAMPKADRKEWVTPERVAEAMRIALEGPATELVLEIK